MQLIIDTRNTCLTTKNQSFWVENDKTSRLISPRRVTSIAISGNCTLSSSAIRLAARNQIPMFFMDRTGKIEARTWSPYFSNLASIRKHQLSFGDTQTASKWVTYLLLKKARLQAKTLKGLLAAHPSQQQKVKPQLQALNKIKERLEETPGEPMSIVRPILMGIEGASAAAYFKALICFLPEEFKSEKRTRRPAKDAWNAALNYAYGMTYGAIENGVFAAGLDPMIGYLHVEGYKRKSLVFDLIEPYRPVVDRFVLDLFLQGELKTSHFSVLKSSGVTLAKEGKKILIPAFNSFLEEVLVMDQSRRKFKDHMYYESRQLIQWFQQEQAM